MPQRLRVLLLFLSAFAIGMGVLSGSAQAYTITGSGTDEMTIGDGSAGGNTGSPVAISASVSNGQVVFSPAASGVTGLPDCTTSQDLTSCAIGDLSTSLTIQDAYDVDLDNVSTNTLILDPTDVAGSNGLPPDQYTLTGVSLSGLDLEPNDSGEADPGGQVSLDASGSIHNFNVVDSGGNGPGDIDSGTLSLDLQTIGTSGSMDLEGSGNDIDAPQTALDVTSSGGDATITTGGTVTASGPDNLINATSTTQAISGGGSSAVNFLDVDQPLTLDMQNGQTTGTSGDSVVVNSMMPATITGIDALMGGAGKTTLIADSDTGASADDLIGGSGQNTFQIDNTGPDQINGGTGNNNTVDYSQQSFPNGLTVDLNSGTGGPTGGVPATQDVLTNIQNVITGDSNDATVIAGPTGGSFSFGNGSGDSFTGGPGSDVVTAGDGNGDTFTGGSDASSFTVGAGSGDTLTGGSGTSVMSASGPNTTFNAGFGQNTIVGGGGGDTLSYANRTQTDQGVTVTLSASQTTTGNGQPGENDSISGIQKVIGGAGYNILNAEDGSLTLVGGPNGNQIDGGSGDDTLVGGAGNDIINSGTGSGTTIQGNGGDDTIDATQGNADVITCGSGSSKVAINSSDTNVTGCSDVYNPTIKPTPPPPPVVVNTCTYVLPGQSCNGQIQPYPVIRATIQPNWNYYNRYYTQVQEMQLADITAGSGVSIKCQTPALGKHGCPFRAYAKNFSATTGRFSVLKLFKRAKIAPGTQVTFRVTNPLRVGIYTIFRLRTGDRAPSVTSGCLNPTTGRTMRCPANGEYTP